MKVREFTLTMPVSDDEFGRWLEANNVRVEFCCIYEKHIVVEGSGEFPLDCLRYESAFPMTENDAYTAQDGRGKRRVALTMRSVNNLGPTEARWKSFSWLVIGIFDERHDASTCVERGIVR